jgi:hypothetical protein
VEANSTGGQGSRRAVATNDDDDEDDDDDVSKAGFAGTVLEISPLKGTQLIRFITPQPPPPLFLPEDEIRSRFRNVVILIF